MSTRESVTVESPLATFRLTRTRALQWVVVSTAAFFAFAYGFAAVRSWLLGRPLEPVVVPLPADPNAVRWLGLLLVLVVLVSVLHEAVHGICMAAFGEAPSFGLEFSFFVVPYAYTGSTGNYTRDQMLVVLLGPLVVLSALGTALLAVYPSSLLVLGLAVNAAGSVGDLWMAVVLARYPSSVRVGPPSGSGVDGFGIYGTASQRSPRANRPTLLSSFLAGAVGTFALSVGAVLALVFLSLAFGTGTVVVGDPQSGWFLFRHDLVRASGVVFLEVGHWPLFGLCALGGVSWATVETVRHRAV